MRRVSGTWQHPETAIFCRFIRGDIELRIVGIGSEMIGMTLGWSIFAFWGLQELAFHFTSSVSCTSKMKNGTYKHVISMERTK